MIIDTGGLSGNRFRSQEGEAFVAGASSQALWWPVVGVLGLDYLLTSVARFFRSKQIT